MSRPIIATILENGTYGEREMTDQEIEEMNKLERPTEADIPRPSWSTE